MSRIYTLTVTFRIDVSADNYDHAVRKTKQNFNDAADKLGYGNCFRLDPGTLQIEEYDADSGIHDRREYDEA
jgi:hypothetical protein